MKDVICKIALLHAARQRMIAGGYDCFPPIRKPRITRRHIDGPYFSSLDGRLFWLSPWERLLTKLGIWDAWDIEWRHFPLPSRDSGSGSQSEDKRSLAEAVGPQSGAAKTAHRPHLVGD